MVHEWFIIHTLSGQEQNTDLVHEQLKPGTQQRDARPEQLKLKQQQQSRELPSQQARSALW